LRLGVVAIAEALVTRRRVCLLGHA
jgi:hypothetical protein